MSSNDTNPHDAHPDDVATEPGRGSQKTWWLDKPQHVDMVYKCVLGLFWAFTLGFPLLTWISPFGLFDDYDAHAHFDFENIPGFYGWYGFVGCVVLVLSAKLLRTVVMRDEWYYNPPEQDPVLPDPAKGGHRGH